MDKHLVAKRQTSVVPYLQSSFSVLDRAGRMREAPRPFSPENAVMQYNAWIYAAIDLKSDAAASVPLRLYTRKLSRRDLRRLGYKHGATFSMRKPSKRALKYLHGEYFSHRPSRAVRTKVAEMGDDLVEVVENHPAMDVLTKANPFMSGSDLTKLRHIYKGLTGNAYVLPIFAGNRPAQMWPLPSQWVWIVPSEETFIKGYVYGRSIRDADREEFSADEVLQFKRPNPRSLLYGLGDVEACWSAIGLHNAERASQTATYENNGRPDYLLMVKSGAPRTEIDRFEQEVESKLRGVRNHGRWLTVGGDVDLKPLQWAPKDLGDPESVVEEIAAVTKVPVSMLKSNDPNLASAEVGHAAFFRFAVHPLCLEDESTLNDRYLPMWDLQDAAFVAYDDPVPENKAFELERITRLATTGVATYNEARVMQGLDRLSDPNADKLMFNGQPLGGVPAAAPSFAFSLPRPATPAAATPQPAVEAAADSALNGAHVQAARDIVLAVSRGELPRDSGIGMLQTFFNLTPERAEQVMGSAGTDKPTTPNPNPAAAQPASAQGQPQQDSSKDLLASVADKMDKVFHLMESQTATTSGWLNTIQADVGGLSLRVGRIEEKQQPETFTAGNPIVGFVGQNMEVAPKLEASHAIKLPDKYSDIDFTPPEGMRDAARNGLERHRNGESGDGLKPETVRTANEIASGEAMTPEKVREMAAWFARHGTNRQEPGTPWYAAWQLWGGDAGESWSRSVVERMDAADGKSVEVSDGVKTVQSGSEPADGVDDSQRAVDGDSSGQPPISHRALMWDGYGCTCHKAADDTERDDESERLIVELQNAIEGVMRQQRDAVLALFPKGKSRKAQVPDETQIATAVNRLNDELAAAMRPVLEQVLSQAGNAAYQSLGIEGVFEVTSPRVAEFMQNYTAALAGDISQTTVNRITARLAEGLDASATVPELRDIVESTPGFTDDDIPKRAEMIARTESARAYVTGTEQGWIESEVVEGKQWLLAPSACPICEAIAREFNERSVPLGEAFYAKGSQLQASDGTTVVFDYSDVNGPPSHPNCRCGVRAVLKERS